jgi:hypothetical protein
VIHIKKGTRILAALAISMTLLSGTMASRAGSASLAWQDVVKLFTACNYQEECMQKKFDERSIGEIDADRLAVMMIQGCLNIGGSVPGLPAVSGEMEPKTAEMFLAYGKSYGATEQNFEAKFEEVVQELMKECTGWLDKRLKECQDGGPSASSTPQCEPVRVWLDKQ